MRRFGLRGLVVGSIAMAMAMVPRPTLAKRKQGPTQITPATKNGKERRRARRTEDDRSDGGTRRGVLELSLGSVVLGTSALLVGRGIWEATRIKPIVDACNAGSAALDCGFSNPGRQVKIATGLSFGVAAVLGLAGGFLLTRGVRINRDYREFRREFSRESEVARARVSVQPWASVQRPSGGLSLHVRF